MEPRDNIDRDSNEFWQQNKGEGWAARNGTYECCGTLDTHVTDEQRFNRNPASQNP